MGDTSFIKINGENRSGLCIRNSLSFSCIFNKPFFMENIRAKTVDPGLRSSHVGAVHLAKCLSGAKISGNARGSGTLSFEPSIIEGGEYSIDIGLISKGSPSLVSSIVQAVLPIMVCGKKPSLLTMKGGTHSPDDISVTYMKEIFLPYLKRFLGINASLEIIRYGWHGDGEIVLKADPIILPIKNKVINKRGEIKNLELYITYSNLNQSRITDVKKLASTSKTDLNRYCCPHQIYMDDVTERSSQISAVEMLFKVEYHKISVGFADTVNLTEKYDEDRTLQNLWNTILNKFFFYEQSNAVLDENLSDMIIPYFACANGLSSYTTPTITNHLNRAVSIANCFLGNDANVQIIGKHGEFGEIIINGAIKL